MNSKPIDGKYFARLEDGEEYRDGPFETIEEATKEMAIGHDLKPGAKIEVGLLTKHIPDVNPSSIIDQLCDDAQSECGESADEWLGHVTAKEEDDLRKRLNETVQEWLANWGHEIRFGSIEEPQVIVIPAEFPKEKEPPHVEF